MSDVKQEPTLADVLAEMAAMKQTIAQQNETIVQLKGKVAETKLDTTEPAKPEIPKDAIKQGDKEYKFQVAHFMIPGRGQVTAEEAALDEDIIKAILAIPGQGILKEQA
jgi:hypothetical protein